jgi:EAL domain-containing protein (putative c-di-GMP-specific phosphodiesterase class I)
VKIDRSFVDGLAAPGEDEEIVRAVVAMASALGLSVVAEGVELDAQMRVLESLGIQYGQGHLWGRAMDPVAFAVSPAAMRTRMADEIMAAPPVPG